MNTKKYIFILTAVMFLPAVLHSQVRSFDFSSKNGDSKIYYRITSKENRQAEVTYKNTEYGSYKGDITVPDSVRWMGKTYVVSSVGDSAFFGSEKLQKVSLPSTLKSIGDRAFSLSGVRSVDMNDGVEYLGNGVFAFCNSLHAITVPQSVKTIGEYVFASSSLQSLTVNCHSIESEFVFNGIKTLKEVTIGKNVKYIPENIFAGCDSITTLYFNAEDFTGYSPFKGLQSLEKAVIGNGVKTVCDNFIADCKNVTEVMIPNSVVTLKQSAFSGSGITKAVIPQSIKEMGSAVFENCMQLREAELPSGLGVIVEYMFNNCESLSKINFPESLFEIDSFAFTSCASLTDIVLPSSVEHIGNGAFDGCSSVKTLAVHAVQPPKTDGALGFGKDVKVKINCDYVLDYKQSQYWQDLDYDCDLDAVKVKSATVREVFDKRRGVNITEKVLQTEDLSYVITDKGKKHVSLIASEVTYRDDITRKINIPCQILYDGEIYRVTGIESLGVCSSVYIPYSVEFADTMAFSGIDVREIETDKNNTVFTSIDGVLYSADKNKLIAYPSAKATENSNLGEIMVNDNVKIIDYGAFSSCGQIILGIGKNVKQIQPCQDVKQFAVDGDNPYFVTDGQILYSKDGSVIQTAVKKHTPKNRNLTIGESVKQINDKAFLYWDIDTLTVNAVIPPEIYVNTFNTEKSITCVVPQGKSELYKSHEIWSKLNITEPKSIKQAVKGKNQKRKK